MGMIPIYLTGAGSHSSARCNSAAPGQGGPAYGMKMLHKIVNKQAYKNACEYIKGRILAVSLSTINQNFRMAGDYLHRTLNLD